MDFISCVTEVVHAFQSISHLSKRIIRIIGNVDTDGISATSILVQTFRRMDLRFVVSMVKQLDRAVLDMLAREPYEVLFFLDLGSGYSMQIRDVLREKLVFILDHHLPDTSESFARIYHANPHLCGIDGTKEISASGVTYYFSVGLSPANTDLSLLALLGAVGDAQEHGGFRGLNASILKEALKHKVLRIHQGVRIYGITTKPLHKILEYSTNPYIPGVCGSEEGALKFLQKLDIPYRDGLTYRRYVDLTKEEAMRFLSAIMMNKVNPEDVVPASLYGDVYFVPGEEEDAPTHELYEFSTLMNCCGRMGKASLGIGTCLGDRILKEHAFRLLSEYRQSIIDALRWFYASKGTEHVLEFTTATIINAGDHVSESIIGTLTSLVSKSLVYQEGTVVIGMARTSGEDIKVSFRISGFGEGVDLRALVQDSVHRVGGSGGGHRLAAGAVIPQQKEGEFVQFLKEFFSRPVIPA